MKRVYAHANLDSEIGDEDYSGVAVEADEESGNLITSAIEGEDLDAPYKHAPVLDIDVPHKLVPSSTPGHSHLYIDVVCDHEDYYAFLKAAEKIGLLEPGYVSASIDRGFTAVRKPGVFKKPT